MAADKTKLLLVTLNFPYPLNNGGAIAQFYFLERLQHEFDLHIATIEKNESSVQSFLEQFPAVQVHNFYNPAQETNPGILFSIKLKLSRALKKLRKKKNISGHEDHLQLDYIRNLVNLKSDDLVRHLVSVIKKYQVKLVQLDFFETIELVTALPEDCHKIFVSHELRSKRIRLAAPGSSTSPAYKDYLYNVTSFYEFGLLKKYDRVVVFNEDDQRLLQEQDIPVLLSPYAIPAALHVRKQPSAAFNKFLFIGGESHFPNKEGLTWFLESIYGQIADRELYPVYVIGEWSPEFRMRYIDNRQVRFLGQQPDIYDSFEQSVLLAPILSGSGLRTKILDAFVNYLPVFCTPFACEGIGFDTAEHPVLSTFSNLEEFRSILDKPAAELKQMAMDAKRFYDIGFNTEKLNDQRMEVYRSLTTTKAGV